MIIKVFESTEITVQPDANYNNQKVFENDIIIYNLDDANLSEVEFIIRGLKNLKYEKKNININIKYNDLGKNSFKNIHRRRKIFS